MIEHEYRFLCNSKPFQTKNSIKLTLKLLIHRFSNKIWIGLICRKSCRFVLNISFVLIWITLHSLELEPSNLSEPDHVQGHQSESWGYIFKKPVWGGGIRLRKIKSLVNNASILAELFLIICKFSQNFL